MEKNEKNVRTLDFQKLAEGFGCELPQQAEAAEYISKIGSALKAWVECNEKQRSFILLSTSECGDGLDNTAIASCSIGGSLDLISDSLATAIMNVPEVRKATEKALETMRNTISSKEM